MIWHAHVNLGIIARDLVQEDAAEATKTRKVGNKRLQGIAWLSWYLQALAHPHRLTTNKIQITSAAFVSQPLWKIKQAREKQ